MTFNSESTTDEVIAGIDLRGKTAVVTGASAGLGIETAKTLAGAGAQVVMLARDSGKLESAVAGIRQLQPDARIETQLLDLADLASVRSAASSLLERFEQIHLLINNAGVMACPLARTTDGFELQFCHSAAVPSSYTLSPSAATVPGMPSSRTAVASSLSFVQLAISPAATRTGADWSHTANVISATPPSPFRVAGLPSAE